jgi:hypothetical protein
MIKSRVSPGWAWFCTVAASLLILLALVNLLLHTQKVGSWLPLLVIMWWPLAIGLYSLRHPKEQTN